MTDFKRIRRVTKKKPNPDIYEMKRECLAEFEKLSESEAIDVYYGDESGVSLVPNVPYGWRKRACTRNFLMRSLPFPVSVGDT